MKLDAQFFSSPTGQLAALGLLAALAVGVATWHRAQRTPEPLPAPGSTARTGLMPQVFARAGAKFAAPVAVPAGQPSSPPPVEAVTPPPPKILPLALFVASPAAAETPPAAPYGRLIPCTTVLTLESNRLDTPLIGLVAEDVWEQGRRVIPAGAEVHGRAALDRSRGRLASQGTWTIIWRTPGRDHATELQVQGIALDRDPAGVGEHEGTAGLRGVLLRPPDRREARLFAATFLAAATNALQETSTTAGLFGETAVPAATLRNATLAGSGAVLRDHAQQMREAISQDGVYVRVPAGTAFYLYVNQPLAAPAVSPAAPNFQAPPS